MKKYLMMLTAIVMMMCGSIGKAQSLSQLKFNDYSIENVMPESLTSISGKGKLTLTNNGPAFKMKNIRVQVYKNGAKFVKASVNDISIIHGKQTIGVSGLSSLNEGVSFWTVLSSLAFKAEEYKFDVTMTIVTATGIVIPYEKKNISAAKLLGNKLGTKPTTNDSGQ
ncbi:MAG: hypothetical protein KBT20_11560 [Bacteroidales bacterium]|nr:hypothetical protein [Candidatus Liminaster caballi]